jgi:putative ABC transport system ATP-binding protein
MIIRLEQLIPIPLLEQELRESEVWEQDSLLFEAGKSYLVTAPSGKGKTTLLSVIYGIRPDYRGRVFLDDMEIASMGWKAWSDIRKRSLSYIFQGLELFENLTAIENINLKNEITGHQTGERIEEMATRLGILPYLNRKAGILSFGQQQRVAIIRALCQPFSFLLADECFSHIDRENLGKAYSLIREECQRQGAGLILTALNHSDLLETDVKLTL